jgi:Kef-type K+ transport system membrane component KefB
VVELSFTGLLAVAAVAFAVPLALGLAPRLRLPAGATELVVGIAIGPSALGWVEIDRAIEVLAALGLAFLLFLAGLELDPAHLRGRPLRLAGLAYLTSLVLAGAVGLALQGAGLVDDGVFVAIALSATSLGAVAITVGDAGEAGSDLGRVTLAGAALANVGAVVLLSLFFSEEGGGTGARLVLLGALVALAAVVVVAIRGLERSRRLAAALLRLQDTSAQVRVRGAFVLLVGSVALAAQLGVEAILAAFAAGAVLALVDRDAMRTHPQLMIKLEGAGFGFFIPVFMVAAGLRFDLDALLEDPETLVLAPMLALALLLVRGAPALLYRPLVGARRAAAAGLLQATSLPFIVVAVEIGRETGSIGEGVGAALIAAGLVSLFLFPEAARAALAGGGDEPALARD